MPVVQDHLRVGRSGDDVAALPARPFDAAGSTAGNANEHMHKELPASVFGARAYPNAVPVIATGARRLEGDDARIFRHNDLDGSPPWVSTRRTNVTGTKKPLLTCACKGFCES